MAPDASSSASAQRGLARPALAHERNSTNIAGGVVRHAPHSPDDGHGELYRRCGDRRRVASPALRRQRQHLAQVPQELLFLVRLAEVEIDAQILGAGCGAFPRFAT